METRTALLLARDVFLREAKEALYLRTGWNITRPSDIKITLTDRCNYRCEYCDHWRRETYRNELDFEQWRGIVDGLRSFLGRFTIQFSGGEPMLSPAFLPLVEHCRASGIRWGVITNGSMLRGRTLERFVRARPLNVDMSVDSDRAAAHDRVRGVPGSLARLSENLARLIALRDESGQRFPIRIKPTVHAHNFDHLRDIVTWAQGIGDLLVDFSPVRLGKGQDRDRLYVAGDNALARLDAEIEALIAMKEAGAPIETGVDKLRAISAHFRGEPVRQGRSACLVGLRTLDIRPDGQVNHCWRFHNSGNLTSEPPEALWQRVRRTVAAEALACEHVETRRCGTSCTAHRSLSQDISRGLRYAGLRKRAAGSE